MSDYQTDVAMYIAALFVYRVLIAQAQPGLFLIKQFQDSLQERVLRTIGSR
jgi:hypothetical protein